MQDRFKYRAWDKENKKYIYDVEKGTGKWKYWLTFCR